ncbi:hypothetical protein Gekk315_00006 [Aeromonas phage Gekk3-15]
MTDKIEGQEVSEVVVAGVNTAVAVQGDAPDWMADIGAGFENTDADSFAIPFLVVLQKMSPMCDEDDPAYVEGAKAGMIFNTVTREMYDGKEGITIIPCSYRRHFIKWGGREGAEQGFKGSFTPAEIDQLIAEGQIIEHEGKLLAPIDADGKVHEKKSDRYSDTREHLVMIVAPDGSTSCAILALSSTQIKASKMLMMMLNQKKVHTPRGAMTPPTFANLVKFTTKSQSNDKGTWSGAQFELDGMVTDNRIYQEAKAFHASFVAGEVGADYTKAPSGSGAEEEEAKGF